MGGTCSSGKNRSAARSESFKTFGSFRKRNGEASDRIVKSPVKIDSSEARFSLSGESFRSSAPRKSDARRSSFFGKAGVAGLERAAEVFDALGSGVANLNPGGFVSRLSVRGNKISVLAFEVANTITRGASLMQSLCEENVHHLKAKVFFSRGVQHLASTDPKVLLGIAAADKREELDAFCREVVRFGGLCKDPQWHNLDRLFSKLDLENEAYRPRRHEARLKMHDLTILAQDTADLYHELNALDRFEQEYQQKHKEAESLKVSCKESLVILQTNLKHQRQLVMTLKRKSLWSKRMEEVVEKLVAIVASMHYRISEVFGNTGGYLETYPNSVEIVRGANKTPERLGAAGLALHYANIISQLDNIASRPLSIPPNTRDSLYNALPTSVKNSLRSSLRRSEPEEELSLPLIKAEMESIFEWLVPMATITAKVYQGFGWVGEWANTSHDFHKQTTTTGSVVRLQTLYHADKRKTDAYILTLVKLLHRLISAAKRCDHVLPKSLQGVVEVSREERNLLEKVGKMQPLPIFSRSRELRSIRRRSFMVKESNRSSRCRKFSRREDVDCDLQVLSQLDLAF